MKLITFFRSMRSLKLNKFRNYSTKANTIYALSSGYGRCGVSVIRVSGPQSGLALKAMTKNTTYFEPRKAYLKKIYHVETKNVIDKGLILWFAAPNSFTGEDSFEFQVHGSLAVINAIFDSLNKILLVRPANAGEFTKRAFLNGKLDLTEVEGLSNLLEAETEMQRVQAFLQSDGHLSKIYKSWRQTLLKNLANIEAVLDFDETEDLDPDLLDSIAENIKNLYNEISKNLEFGKKGEILKNGVKTVIIGEPNVGKSSLLNNLCQKPKAIVSPIEGTTRDLLETSLDINGYPLVITDTAGLRIKTNDIIEKEGISRAKNSIREADFVLILIDASKIKNFNNLDLHSYFKTYLNSLELDINDISSKKFLIIFNKCDLLNPENKEILENVSRNQSQRNTVLFSCTSNEGREFLFQELTKNLETLCGNPSQEHPCMSQERHRNHLNTCLRYLTQFLDRSQNSNSDLVLLAEDLRMAMRQIGKLTGEVTTEDLLNVIFKDFCIGK